MTAARQKGSGRAIAAAAALLGCVAAVFGAVTPPVDNPAESLALSSDLRVRVRSGREIELSVRAGRGDDLAAIAARVAGDRGARDAIAACNAGAEAEEGGWVRVPLALLSPDFRALALHNLFPEDRRDGSDWIHVAQAGALPTYDEGLWQIAEWFTGNGKNFEALITANGLSHPEVDPRQAVRIPAALLDPAFRPRPTSDDGTLEFDRDAQGPYAGYRLRHGEALYSAVVVRFTGRTAASDVSEIAEALRERNAITDLHDIPAGLLIKIPLDLVEPDYLPADHPRRAEAEASRAELARELAREPVTARSGLEGVVVILDPGHGGRDMGTINNGIWEHDYVYDVTCRVKQKLEHSTAARVVLTLEDRETGCVPSSTDELQANLQGTILTDPPFMAREQGEATIGVNLRWYLANSIHRNAVAKGIEPERVIFVSLHADSRHPSLGGVMVYVPGAEYLTRTYGKSSSPYDRYREVREQPHVRFSRQQRVRAEALSRRYADAVVDAFRAEGLPVQPYQPVRNRIIRGNERFVPAVLRGNVVPNRVLVEMVNLSNREDAALLASARDRDRLAEGLFRSLLHHFGEPDRRPRTDLAAGAR